MNIIKERSGLYQVTMTQKEIDCLGDACLAFSGNNCIIGVHPTKNEQEIMIACHEEFNIHQSPFYKKANNE